MKRTHDAAFFECPICGKKPYISTYGVNVAWAFCKGYGFHKHKKIETLIPYAQPSILLKKLSEAWNQMLYVEARFLFYQNGFSGLERAPDELPKEE